RRSIALPRSGAGGGWFSSGCHGVVAGWSAGRGTGCIPHRTTGCGGDRGGGIPVSGSGPSARRRNPANLAGRCKTVSRPVVSAVDQCAAGVGASGSVIGCVFWTAPVVLGRGGHSGGDDRRLYDSSVIGWLAEYHFPVRLYSGAGHSGG